LLFSLSLALAPSSFAQTNAIQEKPWTRMHLDLQALRLAGDQSHDTTGVTQSVLRLEKNIVLDRDGHFSETNISNFPGGFQFKFLNVGSKEAGAVVDLLKWRSGIEISRLERKAALTTYANALLFSPQKTLEQASEVKEINPELGGDLKAQSMLDTAGRPMKVISKKLSGDITSIELGPLLYEYSDYHQVGTHRQPKHIRVSANGKLQVEWAAEVKFSVNKDKSIFDLPPGYVEGVVDNQLRATLIAPDTYRVDGTASGSHTAFSVGSHSIAVYDAPASTNELETVKALIEKTAPGKKIAYVVVSHTHNDHIGGLPIYLGPNLKNILTGKGGSISIQRQWGSNTAQRSKEITAPTEIDLGGKVIQLFPVVSSHASDMLIAYDAQTQIIFQGDMFQVADVGPVTPAFDSNFDLKTVIDKHQLTPKFIHTMHGRLGTFDEFNTSIALRKAMDQEGQKKTSSVRYN
jgi:glyoxylase-like metal-dependent hydrolase (beta-lactamase superfamily II)